MTVDLSKPVQTKYGRSVRILCTNVKGGSYPILALVDDGEEETTMTYTAEGYYYHSHDPSDNDLINVPEERVWYFNVYDKEYTGGVYKHKDEASAREGRSRDNGDTRGIGTIKAVFVDGKLIRAEIVE